jgi:hypothetical protein
MLQAVVWIALTIVAGEVVASRAHACSWVGSAIASSLPEAGASDVPTDVAPIIRGYWQRETVVWETLEGDPVEFDLVSGPSARFMHGEAAELRPRAALAPLTRYVIRAKSLFVEPGSEDRVEFMTGAQAAPVRALAAPVLEATFLTQAGNGCAPGSFVSCISTGVSMSLIEVRSAHGKVLIRDVIAGDHGVWPIERPGCVRAQTRDAAGRLSVASELCEPELASRPARQGEAGWMPLCEHGELRAPSVAETSDAGPGDAGGSDAYVFGSGLCSVAGPGSGASSLTWMVGPGLLIACRWRRRSKPPARSAVGS